MARRSAQSNSLKMPLLQTPPEVAQEEPEEDEIPEEDRVVPPLFAAMNPPVYVDELHPDPEKAIRLSWYIPSGKNKGIRQHFLPSQYEPRFEIKPAETDDADLIAVLRPGEYDVAAVSDRGRVLTSRKLIVNGALAEEEDREPRIAPVVAATPTPQTNELSEHLKELRAQNADLQKRMLELAAEKHDATLKYVEGINSAHANRGGDTNAVVETLREELSDLRAELKADRRKHDAALDEERLAARKALEDERAAFRKQLENEQDRHRKDVDALRDDHRAAMAKRDKEAAEERADFRAALAKKDKDADDERRRLLDERDGVKKSLTRENETDRERLLREARETRDELKTKNQQLEEDLRALRATYDKAMHEARKTELEIKTQLAHSKAGAKVRDTDDDEDEEGKGKLFEKAAEAAINIAEAWAKSPTPATQPTHQPVQQQPAQQHQQPAAQSQPAEQPAPTPAAKSSPDPSPSADAPRENPTKTAEERPDGDYRIVRMMRAQRADPPQKSTAAKTEPEGDVDEDDEDADSDEGDESPSEPSAELSAGTRV